MSWEMLRISRYRMVVFFVFMGVFSAVFQLGSMSEVSEEDASIFMEQFEELIKDIDGPGIFLHNTFIALPMFLPGAGIVWGMVSAAATGYAFAAITTLTPELGKIPPLAILYLSPFGIMELVAYSTATSRSWIIITSLIKKTGLQHHIIPSIIEVGIVVGLLLAGGFLEYYMLEMVKNEGFTIPGM